MKGCETNVEMPWDCRRQPQLLKGSNRWLAAAVVAAVRIGSMQVLLFSQGST